ncbi:MAG: molybdate ABC transporter substrate-binding protein [Actinomycetota bacterium]
MRRQLVVAAAAAALLGACGAQSGGAPPSDGLIVFAAASLTETFTELGEAFEADNPGVTVTFSFGGSSSLAQQIVAGAPADVFAAASVATMDVVEQAGEAVDPVVLVRNRLQIAVPPGNPGDVTGLADFGDPDRTIALCAPEVPCGAAAVQVLQAAGVTPASDTLERDVKAALSKVRLGEVDAALVYRTDVLAAGSRVEGIDVPEAAEVVGEYPVTVLADAPNPESAQAFVDFLGSPEAREVFADAGFELP